MSFDIGLPNWLEQDGIPRLNVIQTEQHLLFDYVEEVCYFYT